MTTTPNEPLKNETNESATNQPAWGTASSTPPGARFFDTMRRLEIVRPDEDRWIAGVASGIARRYNVDPVVARIAFGVLTLLAGLGVALYGLGWLFLPHPDGRIHAQQVLTGTVTAGFVGALLTVLVSAYEALPLIAIALVVWLVIRHRKTNPIHAS
jgi:phage shock protein PspC (stress-responsive transcriptional regulator)